MYCKYRITICNVRLYINFFHFGVLNTPTNYYVFQHMYVYLNVFVKSSRCLTQNKFIHCENDQWVEFHCTTEIEHIFRISNCIKETGLTYSCTLQFDFLYQTNIQKIP